MPRIVNHTAPHSNICKYPSNLLSCSTHLTPTASESADWCYYAFPLAWAAAQGDVDLVNRLLACGADPNLKGRYYGSVLHACAWEGKDEVARILLEHGADPNIQDHNGWTPLHCASHWGLVVVVK
ncbi:ankyrin [Coprinellus micaceus]|uniref:Ankyrin n=1 Tax=Coprinellus micaceus TaxID=71717 RepID=A0A4Y7SLC5_COPMI|nr:ankyrin [Coprinellus micaceus]